MIAPGDLSKSQSSGQPKKSKFAPGADVLLDRRNIRNSFFATSKNYTACPGAKLKLPKPGTVRKFSLRVRGPL